MSFRDFMQSEILNRLQAGGQAISISSNSVFNDAYEIGGYIKKFSDIDGTKTIYWDIANGFYTSQKNLLSSARSMGPMDLLENIYSSRGEVNPEFKNATVIAINFDKILAGDLVVAQKFQSLLENDLLNSSKGSFGFLIMATGPAYSTRLEHLLYHAKVPLPNFKERKIYVEDTFKTLASNIVTKTGVVPTLPDNVAEVLADTTAGMTRRMILESLSYATSVVSPVPVLTQGVGSPELLKFCQAIEDEKKNQIQSVTGVQYISRAKIGDIEVGGFEGFKSWLSNRKICFTPKAKEFGLDNPKGVVLLGVPGTGKSRTAKLCAKELGIPLVILKISELLNSLVGESEQNLLKVLNAVDAIDGCVLLIDEADKMLAGGASGAHAGDSGVFKRIYGTFLQWSQDSTAKTFKILTANRTSGFDPEALRKGRFDEVFYVDFPDNAERREIFEIHMKIRNIDMAKYNNTFWNKAIQLSSDFNGAEIEVAVSEAKLQAANNGRISPTADEILAQIVNIKPMATQLTPEESAAQSKMKQQCRMAGKLSENDNGKITTQRRVKIEG